MHISIRQPFACALLTACGFATLAHAEEAAPKITYDDHIRPIFREHCLTCHNSNQKKGDLALDSYGTSMAGGGSGAVVVIGDLGSSRLYALASHQEEPKMPPNQDRIADAKLELIKKWIEGGSLENSGSVAKVSKQPTIDLGASAGAAKPEGPVAMPEGLFRQPVVHTARTGAVTALAASPWAPLAAVAGQKQVLLYNTDSGRLLGVLPFPEGTPHVLKFSRSGSLLLAGGGRGASMGKVIVFDVKTGNRVFEVGDELDVVLAADINNTHTQIALSGPGKIVRIFSTKDGTLLHELRKHTDWVYALEYSPDGVLLATSDRSNGLFVWETETGREYQNLQGHQGAVTDVSWRFDSNVLASASLDGTIRLWEMENGKQIKNWGAHGGGVESVEFTHDARILSAGRDKLAKSWDGNGTAIKNYEGLSDFGLEATFSHDGARAIAGDLNGQVFAWDAKDGKQLFPLSPNPPTLELAVETEAAKAAAAEQALAQTTIELAMAQDALKNVSSDAVNKATTAKAEADKSATDKAAALKAAEELVAAATAKTQQATDEATKQSANAELTAATAAKDKAAADLTAAQQAVAAQEAVLKTATEQFNAANAAAQKLVGEKDSVHKTASAAATAARETRDAAVAEKAAYDQSRAASAQVAR